jgi:hypothetical protein
MVYVPPLPMNLNNSAFGRKLLVYIVTFFIFFLTFAPASLKDKPTMTTLTLRDGTKVLCEMPKEPFAVSKEVVVGWIESNACAIRAYYGKFPVPQLALILRSVEGSSSISYGNTFPGKTLKEPPRITIFVGTSASEEEFRRTWLLAHEMTHLTFPSLEREYHWLEEGIATYVEPIARAMTGLISSESVWYDLQKNIPRGIPDDESGLDGAHDFGRIYWGGALFCLLADLEIRRVTDNKHSFQDALKAIMHREGTINTDRDIVEVLRTGDSAVGTTVLATLYEKMGKAAYKPDMEKLWLSLGVERSGDSVVFREDAPLASVRRNICSRGANPCSGIIPKR